jgi:hypothetical protein
MPRKSLIVTTTLMASLTSLRIYHNTNPGRKQAMYVTSGRMPISENLIMCVLLTARFERLTPADLLVRFPHPTAEQATFEPRFPPRG